MTHWLQRNKKKSSKQQTEEAKQAIFAMAEEAQKKARNAEIKKEKPRSVQDLQYKDN